MSLADALEDERRETVQADVSSSRRRGSTNPTSTGRISFASSLKPSDRNSSSARRRSTPNAGETLSGLQPAGGRKPRKQSASADAMAAILGGSPKDFKVSSKTRASDRRNSTVGFGGHSRSPGSPLYRSASPAFSLVNNNKNSPMHLMTDPGGFDEFADGDAESGPGVNDDPTRSGSPRDPKIEPSGPNPVAKKKVEHVRHASGDSGRDLRLQKDKPAPDDAEGGEGESESSEDDEEARSSDEDEALTPDQRRGRRRIRANKKSDGSYVGSDESDGDDYGSLHGQNKSTNRAKNLLVAAEEKRMGQSKAKRRPSEPAISITGPGGEKLTPKKGGVHPNTSYDVAALGQSSANTSDADVSDIRGAQKLSINMSHLDTSVPNRVIRTILRGDFSTMQEEAEQGLRRPRLYLVATDLSDEAVYALEWTIGTILRDGDTLLAIYAIDEEAGTGKGAESEAASNGQNDDGARTAQEAIDAMSSQTKKMNEGSRTPSLLTSTSYLPATSTGSRPGSVDARVLSKIELERQRAIEDISSTCVRLLRKTKLQVRVAIEVIHCKSPKQLITEAIDGLEPTLVILGSRGRSALKGVLLGSFSNYLVTKSSVPVMVARKKLRKHAKFKKTNIRLSNNLQRPNRLISAKID